MLLSTATLWGNDSESALTADKRNYTPVPLVTSGFKSNLVYLPHGSQTKGAVWFLRFRRDFSQITRHGGYIRRTGNAKQAISATETVRRQPCRTRDTRFPSGDTSIVVGSHRRSISCYKDRMSTLFWSGQLIDQTRFLILHTSMPPKSMTLPIGMVCRILALRYRFRTLIVSWSCEFCTVRFCPIIVAIMIMALSLERLCRPTVSIRIAISYGITVSTVSLLYHIGNTLLGRPARPSC
jgi:hypothetical protein